MKPKLTALRAELFAQLKEQNDPRVLGQGDVFDNYPTFKQAAGSTTSPTKDEARSKRGKARQKKLANP